MSNLLEGLNYIGYYDDAKNYIIEIEEETFEEVIKRITKADKVDIIKKYYNKPMIKNEMSIDEAEKIIDNMYKEKYKTMEQKTEEGIIIDVSKMDGITFTNLEFASVRVLREKLIVEREKEKIENKIKEIRDKAEVMDYYTLNNVIEDLSKLIGDYKDE